MDDALSVIGAGKVYASAVDGVSVYGKAWCIWSASDAGVGA